MFIGLHQKTDLIKVNAPAKDFPIRVPMQDGVVGPSVPLHLVLRPISAGG